MDAASTVHPQDRDAWQQEVATIDVGRLQWVWVFGAVISLAFAGVAETIPVFRGHGYGMRSLRDAAGSLVFFAIGRGVSRLPPSSPWRMRYVWLATMLVLLSMTQWYLDGLAIVGQTPDYVLGVIMITAIILAPPWPMAIALAANHAAFTAILITSKDAASTRSVVGYTDATIAAIIAWFVAWFLYRAREAEFAKSRALAAANAELREVMAIAAHDLRSPLLGVRDLLTLARHEPAAQSPALSKVLDIAAESCGAMAQQVSQLVEAHAAEESQHRLRLVPQDLRESCAAACARLRVIADARRQRFELSMPETPAMARVDASACGQVLDNLLGNASKYSPAGAAIECALFANHGHWCVEVRDEGAGVPPDERRLLFQKFHRGAAAPTGGESSTGLGLFIVRTLVEAMGGRVTHEPAARTGSVFRVELPAVR